MDTPQVAGTRPPEAGVTAVWAVVALDPARAHLFGCGTDGRAVSRCGTAITVAPLLLGVRGERRCAGCIIVRIADLLA